MNPEDVITDDGKKAFDWYRMCMLFTTFTGPLFIAFMILWLNSKYVEKLSYDQAWGKQIAINEVILQYFRTLDTKVQLNDAKLNTLEEEMKELKIILYRPIK